MANKETARKKLQQKRRLEHLKDVSNGTIYLPTWEAYMGIHSKGMNPTKDHHFVDGGSFRQAHEAYGKPMSLDRYRDASRALAVILNKVPKLSETDIKFFSDPVALPIQPKWVLPKNNNVIPKGFVQLRAAVDHYAPFGTDEMEIVGHTIKGIYTKSAVVGN